VARGLGASGEAVGVVLFVFGDEPLEEAVDGGAGIEGFDVELAEDLDVDGASVLSEGVELRRCK